MKTILTIFAVLSFQLTINCLYSQELWGITSEGGPFDKGTLFKIDIPSGNHEIEYDFPFVEGISLKNSFESNDGYIYGTTSGYGIFVDGNIIKFNPDYYTYQSIFQFSDSSGKYPGGIIQDSISGYIFGTNFLGGKYDEGTLYKFNPYTNDFSVLFDFNYSLGRKPTGDIINYGNGLIYGVTKEGGDLTRGVLYSFNINTKEYSILFNFTDSLGSSIKNIMLASNGDIYGTTYFGGDYQEGVLFKYDVETGIYSKLVDFNHSIGVSMKSALIEASNGKLYGTANLGGEYNGGVIYEFDMQTETLLIKHNFEYFTGLPKWYLSELEEGILYGCTNTGGKYHRGMVFKFNINADSLTIVNEFNPNIGRTPNGFFIKCSNGKIFSTTERGGKFNYGSLFEFNISDYSMTKINDFYGYTEFHNAIGTPIYSPDGKIYGLTEFKGQSLLTEGSLYSFDKETKEHKVFDIFYDPTESLTNFDNKYYCYPSWYFNEISLRGYFPDSLMSYELCELYNPTGPPTGSMTLFGDSIFFGIQESTYSNPAGLIFSFNPETYENQKHSGFWGSNGAYPVGNSLININDGYLYGITSSGGDNNLGVIFKYNIELDEIIKLYDFSLQTGSTPTGKLLETNDMIFYGLTQFGGSNNYGVIYKFSLSDNTYQVDYNFDSINGANPTGSLIKASNGKLYGLTTNGGNFNKGVIFEFDFESNTYNKIFDFDGANGSYPNKTSLIEVCDFPTIINQPANVEVILGDSAFFHIVISTGDVTGFQWYKDNIPIENATNDTLIIGNITTADEGEYFCKIITKCGSIYSDTALLSFVNGLLLSALNQEIKVFPNPTHDILNIEFDNINYNLSIQLYNIFGEEVFQKKFGTQNNITIDLNPIKKGIYFINVLSETKNEFIKIVKY